MATRKAKQDVETEGKGREEPDEKEERVSAETDVVEIEVSEPEEEEETEIETEEAKPSRTDKKRQRGNAHREALEAAATAARERDEFRRQLMEREQQIQGWQLHQMQQQAQQQGKSEVDKIQDEHEQTYLAFQAIQNPTDAQIQEYRTKLRDIDTRKTLAVVRANGGGGQQASPQQIANYVKLEQIKSELSDVLSNPAAKAWGEGRAYQIASERGMPQNEAQYLAIIREAAEETRHRFGLSSNGNGHGPRRPPPDAATRARHTGIPARSNGGGETVRVTIGRDQRRMAMARYPDLAEDEAIKKWAHGPGKVAAQAQAREKSR